MKKYAFQGHYLFKIDGRIRHVAECQSESDAREIAEKLNRLENCLDRLRELYDECEYQLKDGFPTPARLQDERRAAAKFLTENGIKRG